MTGYGWAVYRFACRTWDWMHPNPYLDGINARTIGRWLLGLVVRLSLLALAIAAMFLLLSGCTSVVRTNDCIVLYDSSQVIAAGQQCHVERVYR